eukprot:Colp12_sorted_trinity150504_noHs@19766
MSADQRKAEVEKKRRKLEELRRAREERKAAKDPVEDATAPKPTAKESIDVNDLVSSLLGEAQPKVEAPIVHDRTEETKETQPEPTDSDNTVPTKRSHTLTESETFFFSIPAKEVVVYSKEIQTDDLPTEVEAPLLKVFSFYSVLSPIL